MNDAYTGVTDVPFEIVDEGDGPRGPLHFDARPGDGRPGGLGGPVPGPVVALLARLASGVLRGHEADALATAAILGGFARNPASLRATVQRHEPAINAFLQEIDMAAVIDAALDPSSGYSALDVGRASTGTLIGGAVLGFVASKLFSNE